MLTISGPEGLHLLAFAPALTSRASPLASLGFTPSHLASHLLPAERLFFKTYTSRSHTSGECRPDAHKLDHGSTSQ